MGTPAMIAINNKDNSVKSIYCHYDGYTVGEILINDYNDEEKLRELISLGNITCLERNVKKCKPIGGSSYFHNNYYSMVLDLKITESKYGEKPLFYVYSVRDKRWSHLREERWVHYKEKIIIENPLIVADHFNLNTGLRYRYMSTKSAQEFMERCLIPSFEHSLVWDNDKKLEVDFEGVSSVGDSFIDEITSGLVKFYDDNYLDQFYNYYGDFKRLSNLIPTEVKSLNDVKDVINRKLVYKNLEEYK